MKYLNILTLPIYTDRTAFALFEFYFKIIFFSYYYQINRLEHNVSLRKIEN